MRTNIVLNDELIKQAFMYAPFIKTKKDLIETALKYFDRESLSYWNL